MGIAITFRPLTSWPVKPTPNSQRRRSPFSTTWSKTIDLLERELGHISAKNVVIEADCEPSEIRIDGHLRTNAKLRGPGVVVSFDSPKGSLRFPCDTYSDWQANVRAISLALEALRAVDRYGVTQHAEQYKGWTALPDVRQEQLTKRQKAAEWIVQAWITSFGASCAPTREMMLSDEAMRREIYKGLARHFHPDRCGNDTNFKLLQDAIGQFAA